MSLYGVLREESGNNRTARWQDLFLKDNQRDLKVQIVISIVFGASAFLSFCVLRPRWTELYNARKKQSVAARRLPELPKTLFGWIPVVYRINQADVLASAGLDAYAFLSFFRYAIRYLSVTLFFSLTVILPVNWRFTGELGGIEVPFPYPHQNITHNSTNSTHNATYRWAHPGLANLNVAEENSRAEEDLSYLWMYTIFTYFFTIVAIILLIIETKDLIRIRQAYLGNQSTITDRTIRLSGVPVGMRSKEQIRTFIEGLEIGRVESVMLCCNWRRIDNLMTDRMSCLRSLETAWSNYLGTNLSAKQRRREVRPHISDGVAYQEEETTALLTQRELEHEHATMKDRERPMTTIRYGFLGLRGQKIDAIDYFEEKLRQLDERIRKVRQEEFEPTALAFVTMESTAACQMAVQAILDPNPGQFLSSLAPPPEDVLWQNTYLTRNSRMLRSWSIMVFIGVLTIFWAILLFPIAGLLSIEAIDEVFPGLADVLDKHPITQSLIQNSLPTLTFTLLSVLVPYFYDWLSYQQGMTSVGDVELSIISKNFFFTFFNLFVVFTIWGSASQLFDFWKELRDILKDTTGIAFAVYNSLTAQSPFYTNLIVLQGLGLFPFRLLEFGSVALYPFYLMNARTPRDHAELAKAPVFSYGFYLPQTMLIFVICIVYSVLPRSWLILLFGLIYFFIGSFIYKYQLLYAMDHRQHSTGKAWPMICKRIFMGLIIFHIAMAGLLTLRKAIAQAILIVPLLIALIWFTVYFQRTYDPLMNFIALRSIEDRDSATPQQTTDLSPWDRHVIDDNQGVETDPDTGAPVRYTNPNLVSPLETLWVRKPGHLQSQQGV